MHRFNNLARVLFALALLLSPTMACAWADDESLLNCGRGPLPIRDNFMLSHQNLHFTPDSAAITPDGGWEVEAYINWSNTFAAKKDRAMRIDGESIAFVPNLNYGLNEWCEVGIEIPMWWRVGGAMDAFIEGFHNMLGYANNDRNRYDENDFDVFIRGNHGQTFHEADRGFQLGNIDLKGRANVLDGDDSFLPAVTLGLDIALPTSTGDEVSGSDGVDVGLSAYLSKHLGADFYLHLNGGVVFRGDSALGNIGVEDTVGNFGFAVEWACTEATSIVAQGLYQSAQFAEGPGNLPRFSFYYSIGVKTEPWEGVELEFGAIENELKYDNSADFGIQVGAKVGF